MRVFVTSLLVVAFAAAAPGAGSSQQVVESVPLGTELRVSLGSGGWSSGRIDAIDGCTYVRLSMGLSDVLAAPLDDVTRMEVRSSDPVGGPGAPAGTARPAEDSVDWIEVDIDSVLAARPDRCEDQPFTKLTPLRVGYLIRE